MKSKAIIFPLVALGVLFFVIFLIALRHDNKISDYSDDRGEDYLEPDEYFMNSGSFYDRPESEREQLRNK